MPVQNMRLKIFLTTFLLIALIAVSCSAQKLTPATRLFIAQQKNALYAKSKGVVKTDNVLTAILLEKGGNVSDETLNTYGVRVEKRRGRLILAYVPVCRLESLTAIEGIRSIDTGYSSKLYNDISRETTSVVFAHDKDVPYDNPATADAQTKYRGKDVFVCLVDNEIDFGHPAFRDAQGKSRIKKAIVSRQISGTPINDEYDESDIEVGITDRMYENVYEGHGTHVAGTAVGTTALLPEEDPMKKYYGMAPEADILAFDMDSFNDNDVLMAIIKAFDKADEDKRPLALNLSCGRLGTLLDGTDHINEEIDALFEDYNPAGKVICVSSGNNAEKTFTAQIECDKPIVNGEWTLQKKLACPLDTMDLNMAEYRGAKDKEFAVQYEFWYKPESGGEHLVIGTSPILTFDTFQEHLDAVGVWRAKHILAEGDTIKAIVIPVFQQSSRMMHSAITNTTHKGVYAVVNFYTKEEGVYVDALSQSRPFMTMEGDEYAVPNNDGCLNVFACTDNVISVGSYNTRTTYTDMSGVEHTRNEYGKVGQVSLFSGYCTSHYGTPRPDVVAPGAFIVSAMHHNREGGDVMGMTKYNDTNYQWAAMSGTSMASPVVTGIVALWLQADPTLTVEDVREVIAKTSDFDETCAAAPSQAGHGKINALRGLEYLLTSTGIRNVGEDCSSATVKFLDKDGRLVIHRGNHLYDAIGREISR